MICHNCKKNEAEKTFVVNMMGTQYEAHICQDCLTQMWQYAQATGQGEAFVAFSGWWPGKEDPRQLGDSPFQADAGRELKHRLRMNALRARLEEAARNERYEEAARLRDLLSEESDTHTHDNETITNENGVEV